MIPYRYLALAIGFTVVVATASWKSYRAGEANVQAKWNADIAAKIVQAEKEREYKEHELAGVGLASALEAQKERIIERKIYEKITVLIPANTPDLPGGFRVLHDAAALGQENDDTSGLDAPAVAVTDASKTIAQNYAECRRDKKRIIKLQSVVRILNGGGNENFGTF